LYSEWVPKQIKMGAKTKQLLESATARTESLIANKPKKSTGTEKSKQKKKKVKKTKRPNSFIF